MKTKIIWFAIGFLVAWLMFSIIGAMLTRPRDYTASWSSLDNQTLGSSTSWLKNARGIKLGQYLIFAPASKSNASLYVCERKKHFLGVVISDSHTNGTASNIMACDAEHKSISLIDKDGDAIFDSYSVSTGIQSNAPTMFDNNFDGTYDLMMRSGSPLSLSVNINSNWYDLISIDKKPYVQIADTRKRVTATNGVWRFEDE